jgi:hypothetical protein
MTFAKSPSTLTAAARDAFERIDDTHMRFVVFSTLFFAWPVRLLRDDLTPEFIDHPKCASCAKPLVEPDPICLFASLGNGPVLPGKLSQVVGVAHEYAA